MWVVDLEFVDFICIFPGDPREEFGVPLRFGVHRLGLEGREEVGYYLLLKGRGQWVLEGASFKIWKLPPLLNVVGGLDQPVELGQLRIGRSPPLPLRSRVWILGKMDFALLLQLRRQDPLEWARLLV